MTRLREMLRDAWTLIRPYWFSEDRWAGRGLLLVVVVLNLFIVYINVLLSKWYNLFYNSLQDKDFAAFSSLLIRFSWLAGLFIVAAVYQIYLNQMLQIRWRRWLTERYLGAWLTDGAYYRMQLTSGETDNPDQRISDDRRGRDPARLHGVGGAGLRHRRDMAHQPDRPAAGAAQLQPAALRGRLPLQPRALPGEHGRRGPLQGRGRRDAELPRALRLGGPELVGHHAPAEATHLVHLRVRPGRHHLPDPGGRAALLPRRDSPRRADADLAGLRPGPGLAVVHHHLVHRHRGVARGGATAPGLRARTRPGARGGRGRRRAPRDRRGGRPQPRPGGPCAAGRPLPDGRRLLRYPAGGHHADQRPVRGGQEHALPGHRGHLAVRPRRDPAAAQRPRALPAPEALLADRHAPRGRELSDAVRGCRGRGAPRGPAGRGAAGAGRPPRRDGPLGPSPLAGRAAAHRLRPRAGAAARLALPRRGHLGGGRGDRGETLLAAARPPAGHHRGQHRPP